MSSHNDQTHLPPPLNLSGWRKLPSGLMVVGGILSVIGAIVNPSEFGCSWLLAFMFYLMIALGSHTLSRSISRRRKTCSCLTN